MSRCEIRLEDDAVMEINRGTYVFKWKRDDLLLNWKRKIEVKEYKGRDEWVKSNEMMDLDMEREMSCR